MAIEFYPSEHKVGDTLRIGVYPAIAMSGGLIVPSGTAILIDSTILVATPATNLTNLNTKLAGIASGIGYIFLNTDNGAQVSAKSIAMYGSSAVPALSSSASLTAYETVPLATTITFASPIQNLNLQGQDGAYFELVDAKPGTTFQMQFVGNIGRSRPAKDFNTDNIYDVTFEATGLNGVVANTSVAVSLAAVLATAFDFADVSGVALNAYGQSPTTVPVAGLPAGVSVPVSTTGQVSKDSGTTWASTVNVINGDTLLARCLTPGSPAATVTSVTYGNRTDIFKAINVGYVPPSGWNAASGTGGTTGDTSITVSADTFTATMVVSSGPRNIHGTKEQTTGDHRVSFTTNYPGGTLAYVGLIDTTAGIRCELGADGGFNFYNSSDTNLFGSGTGSSGASGQVRTLRTIWATRKIECYTDGVLKATFDMVTGFNKARPLGIEAYGVGPNIVLDTSLWD